MICSDLDDTLLDSKGEYSPLLKESIKKYVDKGGKFMIVTGRMTSGVLPIARELGLKGELASFQGAVIADIETGKILNSVCIETADAILIAEYIEKAGYYFHTYVDDYFILQNSNHFTKVYADICNAKYIETIKPLSVYIAENKITPPKILICEDKEKIPLILEEMRKKFGKQFLVNTSKPWLVEIVPKTINKAVGIQKIAKKYNILREEIICIGDSCNDIEMLEYAGLAAVVANGADIAKERADIIAPSSDENAVGWVIENYGFIKN